MRQLQWKADALIYLRLEFWMMGSNYTKFIKNDEIALEYYAHECIFITRNSLPDARARNRLCSPLNY